MFVIPRKSAFVEIDSGGSAKKLFGKNLLVPKKDQFSCPTRTCSFCLFKGATLVLLVRYQRKSPLFFVAEWDLTSVRLLECELERLLETVALDLNKMLLC